MVKCLNDTTTFSLSLSLSLSFSFPPHPEGLKTPMVSEKLLSFPEVDVTPSSSPFPPRSSNTKGSLNDILENHSSNYRLLPPRDSVCSSPSFEDLQTWQEGRDESESDDSFESERRDQVSRLTDSYSTGSLRRRRKELQKQDSGTFSFEEVEGVETPNSGYGSGRSRVERRRSDPSTSDVTYNRKMFGNSRSGSMGEGSSDSPATLTRRDKTTGTIVYTFVCCIVVCVCVQLR